jgi:hypothetical protein
VNDYKVQGDIRRIFPLNECSGKLKRSIFLSERSSENIKKSQETYRDSIEENE